MFIFNQSVSALLLVIFINIQYTLHIQMAYNPVAKWRISIRKMGKIKTPPSGREPFVEPFQSGITWGLKLSQLTHLNPSRVCWVVPNHSAFVTLPVCALPLQRRPGAHLNLIIWCPCPYLQTLISKIKIKKEGVPPPGVSLRLCILQ